MLMKFSKGAPASAADKKIIEHSFFMQTEFNAMRILCIATILTWPRKVKRLLPGKMPLWLYVTGLGVIWRRDLKITL